MKKHEKLLRAMQDYPAGTKFKDTYNGKEFVSSGVFELPHDVGLEGDVLEKHSQSFVYEANKDQWAEVVAETKPSILDGKVAIHVNNEREFKLLMEHYEGKGWKSWIGCKASDIPSSWYENIMPGFVSYKNGFEKWIQERDYLTTIPFSDFAKEVGIEIPVKLLTSEDGVDLYAGDSFYAAEKIRGGWRLDTYGGEPYRLANASQAVIHPDKFKAFTTKEAAEAWIKKQYQSSGIIIAEGPDYIVKLTEAGARITAKGDVTLSLEELDHIYGAFKGVKR